MTNPDKVSLRVPLSDIPTTQDVLGYGALVEPIVSRILTSDVSNTPLTVGVHGQWGSGKTSFLLLLDEQLRRAGLTPVWFNAWRYEREDNLWSALLQAILLQGRISGSWLRRLHVRLALWWRSISLRDGTWELARKVVSPLLRIILFAVALILFVSVPEWIAKIVGSKEPVAALLLDPTRGKLNIITRCLLGLVLLIVVKPEVLLKVFDARLGIDFTKFSRKRSYAQQIAMVDELSGELEALVSLIGRGRPLVVIVDDLDRCLPEKAIEVLEAIKLFLDVRGCVFVIGMDRDLIENAISEKLKLPSSTTLSLVSLYNSLGAAYFDKLIHLPFAVPALSQDSIKRLVQHVAPDDAIKSCADLLSIALPPNPRTVKRHIQTLVFLRDVAQKQLANNPPRIYLLAKMVIIQNSYRDLYGEIKDDPSLLVELEKAARKAAGPQDFSQSSDIPDAAQAARIKAHLDRYPRVRALLAFAVSAHDSFAQVEVREYIFLARAISEPELRWRESIKVSETDQPTESEGLQGLLDFVKAEGGAGAAKEVFVEPLLTPLGAKESDDPLSLRAALTRTTRLFIIGEGGSGKTTLLRHIAVQMAGAYTSRDRSALSATLGMRRPYVPLLFSASDFHLYSQDAPFLSMISRYCASRNIVVQERTLERALERGDWMFMMDGMDEAPIQKDVQLTRLIEEMAMRYPLNIFIVSTRPGRFEYSSAFNHFDKFRLVWNVERLQQLAGIYLGLAGTNRNVANFRGDLLSEVGILRNPLLVRLAVETSVGGKPINLRDAVGEFIQLSVSRIESATPRETVIAAVRSLGRKMTSVAGTKVVLDSQAIASLFKLQLGLTIQQTFELLASLRETGLIVEIRPGEYELAHDLIAEYFSSDNTSE